MFSKSKPSPVSETASVSLPARLSAGSRNSTFSVLGSDVIITGNVSASVDLHIDGRIEGDLSCASLVQGQESLIKGSIIAETARLAGTVDGSITCRDLTIQSSARINGDVTYENLTIEQGSQIEGRFTHRRGGGANGIPASGATTAQPELLVSN